VIRFELGSGLIVLALSIFCVFDVIGSRDGEIRNLPKITWLFIVLLFPLVGSIAWLVAGRPETGAAVRSRHERSVPDFPEYDRPGRAAATDPSKDEEFLRQVRARAEEQRRRYEEQRRREQQEPDAGS